jgi:hypothetical protein
MIPAAVPVSEPPTLRARRRFEEGPRPLFRCAWERAVFLHYEVDPDALQPGVPFPLDLYGGKAYVSLVAFTLRGLRFFRGGPPLSTHGFLNVRTYVPGHGIYFLAEWLPNPLCVFLGPRLYRLPYRRGRLAYDHYPELGVLRGRVASRDGVLAYEARSGPALQVGPCPAGSLDEFLLERYAAYTRRGARERVFRVWHPPWRRAPVEATVREAGLAASTGPWFGAARPVSAHYSPGFEEVWMGRPERLEGRA